MLGNFLIPGNKAVTICYTATAVTCTICYTATAVPAVTRTAGLDACMAVTYHWLAALNRQLSCSELQGCTAALGQVMSGCNCYVTSSKPLTHTLLTTQNCQRQANNKLVGLSPGCRRLLQLHPYSINIIMQKVRICSGCNSQTYSFSQPSIVDWSNTRKYSRAQQCSAPCMVTYVMYKLELIEQRSNWSRQHACT